MTRPSYFFAPIGAMLSAAPASAQVERVWLTHRGNDPSKVVVNWTTKAPRQLQGPVRADE